MIVLLLQHPHELETIIEGLRFPVPGEESACRAALPIESGLSILFDRGLHFDDVGTCYLWHTNGNCYAIPLSIWSHPASPVRDRVLPNWPYGEQLSFWQQLWDKPPATSKATPAGYWEVMDR
jgi:hypothetical protein